LTLIVDSFAWVEFLTGGRWGSEVRTRLESSGELVSPEIVLAEIARLFAREGRDSGEIRGHLRSILALSSVRPVDVDISLEVPAADRDLRRSARARGLGPPSFADAIILAFARTLDAQVLTRDSHFEGMSETDWVGAER